jgi:hypothetical protein
MLLNPMVISILRACHDVGLIFQTITQRIDTVILTILLKQMSIVKRLRVPGNANAEVIQ